MYEVFGKYFLTDKISSGGMGEVYRARYRTIEGFRKTVAIKRILPTFSSERNFQKLFAKEARISAMLNHTNIVQTYDFGMVGNSYYIAMEYIHGWSLREIFGRCSDFKITIPPTQVLEIFRQITLALRYAHDVCDEDGNPLSVVHRDLGPSNVMITRDGTVKVIDFGVARLAGSGTESTNIDAFKGKFAYTAPELISGKAADSRSDLFSMGIMMYEAITGKHPFLGETIAATLECVRHAKYQPVRELMSDAPQDLVNVIDGLLERDPELRPISADVVYKQLEEVKLQKGMTDYGSLDRFCQAVFDGVEDDTGLDEDLESGSGVRQLYSRLKFRLGYEAQNLQLRRIAFIMFAAAIASAIIAFGYWSVREPLDAFIRQAELAGNQTNNPAPVKKPEPAKPAVTKPPVNPKPTIPPVKKPEPVVPNPVLPPEMPENFYSKARIQLYIEPEDAQIQVNGKALGPFNSITSFPHLELGKEHLLRVEKEGYAPREVRFNLEAGGEKELDIRLVRLTGKMAISTNAPVQVYRDGVLVGSAPVEDSVYVGVHKVRLLNAELGVDWTGELEVVEGQTARLDQMFWGRIECSDYPGGFTILADGMEVGACFQGTKIAPGMYRISLKGPNGQAPMGKFTIKKDQIVTLKP